MKLGYPAALALLQIKYTSLHTRVRCQITEELTLPHRYDGHIAGMLTLAICRGTVATMEAVICIVFEPVI